MKIPSGTAVRGGRGAAGEEKLVGVPKLHSWGKCAMLNKYPVRLDVQHFLWPIY